MNKDQMARKKGSGKPKPLTASELSWACPLKDLPFRTTKDLEPLRRIVGQDRAMEALRLGARIRSQGYNIWTSGVVGTGRMTTIRRILDEVKVDKPDLNDFAYVNNFRDPSMPVLLRFAAGEGRVFCTMMEDALSVLKRRIPSLFEEDQFQVERKKIIHRYQAQEDTLLKDFDAKLRPVGFVLGHVQEEDGSTRTEIFPFIDGQPLTMEELEEQAMEGKIEEEQVEQLRERYVRYREEFNELGHRTLRMASEFRKELGKHDRAAVGSLINTVLEDVRASFPRDRVRLYLDGVKEHILSNLEEYVRIQAGRLAQTIDDASEERGKELDQKYSVNLIIDNYDQKVAPVIVETSPTYTSLFGTIEKKMDSRGYVVSDFSQIRAGSLLRADGGFIIMNAMDVLTDGRIWTALKRLMLYHRLEITSSDSQFQLNQLQPDHVNVNVKIILLGDPSIYHALWASEEDFHKTFKVHAEFDDHTKRTPEMIMNFARFFSQLAEDEALLHCDRSGVAALCEWAVAYTDSQERITLQFSYVADLMREASHFAGLAEARLISRRHVAHALAQRRWRSNSADERLREEITKGTLLIDVKGSRVGQINGLTIYQSGIVSYGKPSRITATVSAGDKGIINIEREVDLSGSIHSKGVLIL
jgi:predicted ATP-dependent protease